METRNGRGRYVRVEGPDGAGKGTQVALAKAYAEEHGLPCIVVREPGGTVFGQHLRNLLQHDRSVDLSAMTEVLLFTADRRHLAETVILPALNKGTVVIGDRGMESTIAYQSAAGGVSEETIRSISEVTLPEWYLRPDELIILNITEEAFEERFQKKASSEGHDKIEERKLEYFAKVRGKYEELGGLPYATAIDGTKKPDDIFATVRPLIFGPEHA